MTWREGVYKILRNWSINNSVSTDHVNAADEIIAFIQSLLDRKAREIEELRDLKQESDRWRYSTGEVNCFNQALDQALSILKDNHES